MRQERFTEMAQEAIALSQQLTQQHCHRQLDVEHVLMALLMQEKSVVVEIMQQLKIDVEAVKAQVNMALERIPKVSSSTNQIYATPRIVALYMAADAEAKKLQDEFISTEHIFIAIVGESSGESYNILHRLGLDKEKVYGALQKVRGGHRVTDARAESKYRSLEKYGYDLTQMAREGKLDPIIGREKEIERVVRILCRLNNNNPLIYGPRNVGKTSIVCGLAQKIVGGETKDILKLKKIIALDIGTALAGTKFRGEFEERLKAIMDEVRESKGEIVLFISDLHLLKGYGLAEGGSDLTKMINIYLRHHEIQCIATASTNDNKLIITEISPELFELFTFTPINEMSLDDTLRVLKALKPKYEVHYNVTISDDAIKSAVTLSKKYIKNGCFPQKAMNLLDEAASKVRVSYFQKDNTNPMKLENSPQSDNYLTVRSENIIDIISELEGIPKTTIIENNGSY